MLRAALREVTIHAPENRRAKERTPDRRLARPAGPLRTEIYPRQGSVDVPRGKHAPRRAVRARRRYSRSGAGERLRPRPRWTERRRGEARSEERRVGKEG